MPDYGPSFQACKLWAKTSAKGNQYFTGRLGGLRVTILENRDKVGDDDATHVLVFGEAAPFQPSATSKPAAQRQPSPEPLPSADPPNSWDDGAATGPVDMWSKPRPQHRPGNDRRAKTHRIKSDPVPF